MSDESDDLILVPQAAAEPPRELIERARREAPGIRARRRSRLIRRATITCSVLFGLAAFAFTQPGRAATGWIAGLAGIGDEPSLEQTGSVPGTAVVLESGELPDGTAFEFVAKKLNSQSFLGLQKTANDREAASIPTLVCFQVDWPSISTRGRGGACTESPYTGGRDAPALETSSFLQPPVRASDLRPASREDTEPRPGPGIFMGIADDPSVARVEVSRKTATGRRSPVPSSTITLDAAELNRLGARHPVTVFLAVLGSDDVRAATERRAQVTATAFDSSGRKLDSNDAFAPLSCPARPPKVELEPDPKAEPQPASPAKIEAIERALECGS